MAEAQRSTRSMIGGNCEERPHEKNRDRDGVIDDPGLAVRAMARLADAGDSPDRRR